MDTDYYDVILRNGSVIDGSGKPPFFADVAVNGDRIAMIGQLESSNAALDIDVKGLIVAPGFLDVHTHDDMALIAQPEMTPKLTQGVTTVIAGNCGISGAPYRDSGDPRGLLRLVFKSKEFVAPTLAGFLRKVDQSHPAVNSAFLTGHTTLRMAVMGEDLNRPATDEEAACMRELLAESLSQGSLGLSVGLFYPPARPAPAKEIMEVAKPLRDYQGICTIHLRDEADGIMESLLEATEIGRAADVPIVVSHHKCMGRKNFGRSAQTLRFLHEQQRVQRVFLDAYPYTACSTVLNEEMVASSEKTLITWCDPKPEYSARDLEEVVQSLGCTTAEALPQLQPAGAVYFMMDEADVSGILRYPATMIGSDGLPGDAHPHPRLWGTFPRVLGRYVREQKLFSLAEAIHKMTGLTASNLGLRNRGIVEIGRFADLCIFDPDSIADAATYEQPARAAVGIHHVLVNGKLALRDGMPTSIRAGRVLRRPDFADNQLGRNVQA